MSNLCIGFTSRPLRVMYGEFWGSSWAGRLVLGAGGSVRSAELHSKFIGWGRVSIGVTGGTGAIDGELNSVFMCW